MVQENEDTKTTSRMKTIWNSFLSTRWIWANRLVFFCLLAVIGSIGHSTIRTLIIPDPKEYPGVAEGEWPSAAYKDFIEDKWKFIYKFIISSLFHFTLIDGWTLISWVLQLVGLTMTYILLNRIYDLVKKQEIPNEKYAELAIGSLFVGIILITSELRRVSIYTTGLTTAIEIAIVSIVIGILSYVQKKYLIQNN